MQVFLKNLPDRASKPRRIGLTLVIDRGLSLSESENLLSAAEPYIDFIKLGFGTALFTGRLKEKLSVYRNCRIPVFFGGTLLEAFVVRDQFDDYLRFLEENNIEYAEVSDGSLKLPLAEKCGYIRTLAKYVTVLSEVGYKTEDIVLTAAEWVEAMQAELEAGAVNIIAEGRESGTVGIYEKTGTVKNDLVSEIAERIPVEKIIWEAPRKSQQVWFIKSFGCNTNLGNIAPYDTIALEALRSGLRGDTFHMYKDEVLNSM